MTDEKQSDEKQPKKQLISIRFLYSGNGSEYRLESLQNHDTVGDLREAVKSCLHEPSDAWFAMKTVQPTKIIDRADDHKPLYKIFSGLRERMIVEKVVPPESSRQEEESEVRRLTLQIDEQNKRIEPLVERDLPRDQPALPVCSSTGYLLRHPVPSNNSCLFISVHYCLTHGEVDDQIGKSMRKIIAETVASDKEHFDDAFLGKSNADYCSWILDDNNWGGAIELSILCKYYKTEIVAIDVKNTILNRFGEDSQYLQRMLLLYDGLHYDPIHFQPLDDNQPIHTLFDSDNLEVLHMAEELAREAKQSHQFTDMNTILMKCSICKEVMDSKAATEHAKTTGHQDFVEINDR